MLKAYLKKVDPLHLGGLAVVLASVLFCSKAIWIKLVYRYPVDPVVLMTLRMLFSLPLFGFTLWRENLLARAAHRKIRGVHHTWILLMGLLGYYLASYFDLVGLQYIPASVERIILYTYPLWVALLSFLFLRERITPPFWVSLGVSYLGLMLLFQGNAAGVIWKGVLAVALSALCYALFLIINGRLVTEVGPKRLGSAAALYSCLAVLLHFGATHGLEDLRVPRNVYFMAFAMAVFSTVIPIFLLNYGLRALGSARTAALSTLGPVSTVVLGWVVLGETFGLRALAGMGLVMAAGCYFGVSKK